MNLSADRTLLQLQIDSSLDAHAVDALIRDLALARAEMIPSIPTRRDEMLQTGSVLIENGQGINIAQRRDGGFRLWLRHRGLGWLGWEIDDRFARGIADFISHRTGKTEALDLIDESKAKRH